MDQGHTGLSIEKFIRTMINNVVYSNMTIKNIEETNLNGWRGLHLNQIFKFGAGEILLGLDNSYKIGDDNGDPIVGK